jgi:Bifunctional DNA primase/polymerase, N-terminal/Primase C terminal 1 (PriCT-1)
VLKATTGAAQIDAWWKKCPDRNVAMAAGKVSGFFVVDIDGEDGEASLRELEEKHGALPPTVEVVTSRGRHCYFRLGEHADIGNTVGTIAAGIDTRGNGGYVMAPPSIHPSGRPYTWSVDSASEFADAPEWLFALLRGADAGKGKPLKHWHQLLTNKVSNGTRNSTLTSVAGKLFRFGVDPILVRDLLLCVNEARCDPPLDAKEVENIGVSVGKTHLSKKFGVRL